MDLLRRIPTAAWVAIAVAGAGLGWAIWSAKTQIVAVGTSAASAVVSWVPSVLSRSYSTAMSILNRFTTPLKAASASLGVPVKLIVSVIIKESSGNPTAKGGAGEYGLMQLMPGTARSQGGYTGPLANLWDPATNIMVGTTVLADCLKREGSNLFNALRAYNGGPGWRGASLKGQAATLVYATQVSAIYNGM